MQTETKFNTKTIQRTANKIPVQMTAFLSWKDIFRLLKQRQRNIVLNITPSAYMQSGFTPEEETVLLKNSGLYTDRFIKRNKRAKEDVDNIITCDSVDELQNSLSS